MALSVYDQTWREAVAKMIETNPGLYLREFVNFNTKLSYKTLRNYAFYVISFSKYVNKPMNQLSFDDYLSYMGSLRETSPSNQIVAYSALRKYSTYMYMSDKAPKDYMERIDRPNATEKQSTIDKRQKGYLDREELARYLENVQNSNGYREAKYWKERDEFLIKLMLCTGLRCSGVWVLDVNSVDVANRTLVTTEKRGKVRTYPLSDEMISLYYAWMSERDYRAKEDEIALFVSEKGTRLSRDRIAEIIHSYAKTIDGKNITPHKLRATFGTMVYDTTKDIYLTQVSMGHSSPQTTELYVRGRQNQSMMTAADIMNRLVM